MGLENRVKNYWKMEKNHLYRTNGGRPDPDGVNDVILHIAGKFKITAKQVKDIINPRGYWGGHNEGY